ncbi:HNH endonuclease [Muricoccus radiodurans]|uniref:HNH endonuclease n=1 Tax=Muricoccus radiodurans TaxID=2231721 RepID=UPI003CF7E500
MIKGRRTNLAAVKEAILKRDGAKCFICGTLNGPFDLHHIIPISKGGDKFDLDNLVLCCQNDNRMLRAGLDEALTNEYLFSIISSSSNHLGQFMVTIESVKGLVGTQNSQRARALLNRMLYANIVSAMETYLSDKLISSVSRDDLLVRRVLENNPDFKSKTYALQDIFVVYEALRQRILDYLSSVIYHNLPKVQKIYEAVFGIEFPGDLAKIYKAILIRHDIVHRNGRSAEGVLVDLTDDDVLELVLETTRFVSDLNRRVQEAV